MIKGEIIFEKEDIDKSSKGILKSVKYIFGVASKRLETYVKEQRLTGGPTSDSLGVRSGRLRGSVKAITPNMVRGGIESGVKFGTLYASVHVGPAGSKKTIRPKTAQYLTIPLDAAKTGVGVGKGSARYGPWGETFVAKSKKGNLIIFGRQKMYGSVKVKGEKVKGLRILRMGKIVPLFLLKKQVQIPARIHPEQIRGWMTQNFIELFKKEGITINE